jgi:tetratricopeptide (TPR) repeat protein
MGGRRRWALAAALLLGGCAASGPPSAPSPVGGDVTTAARPEPDPAADAFFLSQVDQARRAEAQGHWAAAAWAWEAAALVRPEDGPTRARRDEVRRRIEALVAERQAAAEAARNRADRDAATRAYLELLALVPTDRAAAEALRQIERQHARRALAGRFARAPTTGQRTGAADGADNVRTSNSAREHATLLVRQGDFDGAIQLLRDAPGLGDVATRSLLVDTYLQKAESLKQRQPEAARAAVDAALAIDRRHPAALALRRQLTGPPAATARGASAPTGPRR